MTDIGDLYHNLMQGSLTEPRGQLIREMLNVNMCFPQHWWFYDIGELTANVDYIKNELRWYLKGDKSDTSIAQHAEIWNNCIDADGNIQSNYGFYFNEQSSEIIRELSDDGASRRAVLRIYDDGHLYAGAPDVPCTLTMQFLIRHRILHSVVTMRSQDAVFGLRNDIAAFQMFKLILAESLGVPPGNLYLNVASLHVYQRHWAKVLDAASRHTRWTGFATMEDFRKWLA